jgi:hypothetical protein
MKGKMKVKQKFIILFTFASVFGFVPAVVAQYPTVPAAVQAKADAALAEAQRRSDAAWERAWPVIKKEIRQGKPYIPWAAAPADLPQADIPAFPGAMGGGAFSFGGRGGKVYVVTSLEDSGPGTLREACEQGGARIVVFNVAGIIRLKSPVDVRAPYITIAGQTAPGDGVCVAGESFWINTHDVVIRHMRFRRGETDVARRDDALGGSGVGNIIIDHVSASWGTDENVSMYRHMYDPGNGAPKEKLPTVNVTIQNCISSEALDTYNHSYGSTIGGLNSTFARNLWAHNVARNPSIGMYGSFNFVNNVVFNWEHRSADGGDHRSMFNFINNHYKPGPITQMNKPVGHRILQPQGDRGKKDTLVIGRVYATGNIMEGNEKVTRNNWDGGIQVGNLADAGKHTDYIRVNKPFPMAPVIILPAEQTYEFVLAHAGASLPKRDAVDERIIRGVRTGKIEYKEDGKTGIGKEFVKRRLPEDSYKKGIITDISQVGGYPTYKGKPYKDSDKDGMPDDWEKRYHLNPKDPADANGDLNGDGYTNIEKYINGIDPKTKVDWKNPTNNRDTLVNK